MGHFLRRGFLRPCLAGATLVTLCAVILASDNPQKPFVTIPETSHDSVVVIAGEPAYPVLNPPRTGLFNDCAYCRGERAEWYDNLIMLKHMAYECGFDYLLLRFDRIYRYRNSTVLASYFFSATPQTLRFDSAVVRYNTSRQTRALFFPCSSCNAAVRESASTVEDTSFAAKMELIDRAAQFSRSFSSAMLARNAGGGLRIAFSFGLGGTSFVLDEKTGLSPLYLPPNISGRDTGRASYKLAFHFNPERVESGIAGIGTGPVIKNVSISYTDLQQLSVTFTAVSDRGLRQCRFSADEYADTEYFDGGSREGITKALQIDSSHYRLAITVYDVDGNSSAAYFSIFEEKRREGTRKLARMQQMTEEHIWAQKNAVNGALDALGRFDGNIGQWFKAIADASIAQDKREDSLIDARMRASVHRDTAHTRRQDTGKPQDSEQPVEIIGE